MSNSHKVHIDDLHFDHKVWKRELNFYKDELKVFQNRLDEVGSRYTDKEVLKELDHFQNQLFIESNVIDELLHEMNVMEHDLSERAKANPVAIDHERFDDHAPLRDKVETNRKMMTEMKADFNRYLTKWM
ncbi:MAG: hypothetical protein Salg2KO_07390 [Salibacteraceae bacterium]